MTVDFQRVRCAFQAVAEPPPAERIAALERECGGDAELRRRVEVLLKAHDDSCELLAAQAVPTGDYSWKTSPGSVPAFEPGQLFAGRYTLREKLGEGGMGVAFVADQTEPVQRRAALKIIRAGLDTHRLVARFEQERQALALMDQPNFAKAFDAGMDPTQHPQRKCDRFPFTRSSTVLFGERRRRDLFGVNADRNPPLSVPAQFLRAIAPEMTVRSAAMVRLSRRRISTCHGLDDRRRSRTDRDIVLHFSRPPRGTSHVAPLHDCPAFFRLPQLGWQSPRARRR